MATFQTKVPEYEISIVLAIPQYCQSSISWFLFGDHILEIFLDHVEKSVFHAFTHRSALLVPFISRFRIEESQPDQSMVNVDPM